MAADLPLFAALTLPEPSATSDVRAAHRLLSGPFSALAEALFESIERLQAEDPFRRVEVVVSSNYLAVDLRRRLAARIADAGRRAGHANVRFSTFLDVAREVAGDVAGKPAPPGILFAAVAGAVGAAPAVEPFRGLRHRPGFLRSVEATVRDLRDADVSVRQFSEWTATSPASRRESLEALAEVYADVSRRLDPFADDVAVFRGAIRSAGTNPSKEPLLVFGFYDLTGMQRDLVAALAHARPLEVFLPEFEGDLGRFAEGTREFLEDILGPRQEAAPVTVPSAKSDWSSRFAGTGTGAKLPLAPDGSIRLVSAADDTDEAREIAREILRSHADGIPLAKTAVILRQEEADSPRILAELARAGIPAFRLAGEANSKSPAGRAIRYWLQLEEDGFRREDVLDVLELVETARGGSNSALFRKLASQAGIVRGIEDWDRGTERLTRARPEDDEDETEKRSGSAARTASGREAAEKLARTWFALRESATGWSDQPLSWVRWAEELRGRIARLFAPQEPPEVISTAADSIASLDSAGQLVGKQVALETFLSALERQRVPGGRLGRDGVAVLSAMSARGLSFDHVLVPGLVERKFPAMARPDPLLSDEERKDVARATSRPLAEKVFPRPDEERLLFAACADAARRRLTLLAARRDASLDRERTPSQFFTRAVDAFEGRPVETRDYSSGDRRPAALRATKLGAHGEERPALNATEARLRTLRVHGATTLALAFPPLARAREAARLRGRREYGPFEGRIRDPELLAGVWDRLSESPLSPSAIETFAKCPYRFFFQRVLRVRAFDEASERGEVDDLGRGSLFHDAARRIAWERRGVAFRSLGARETSELSRRHATEALGAWEEENGYGLGPALVRGLTEARLVEELEAWLRQERENPGAFAPAGAEVRFGPRRRGAVEDPELSSDEPLVCETSDGRILLAGRIDLVAVGEAGTLLRVTDFKVPRNLTTAGRIEKAAREKGQFVFSGELSQLPVYGLFAAEALCGAGGFPERIRAEYLYVGPSRSGGPIEVVPIGFDVEARGGLLEGFQNVLSTIETALREGVFRPRTKGFVAKEPCLFCDYKPICGPGHVKRYARKEDDRDPGVVALAGLEKIL